jgi:hypothetical protein
MTANSIPRSGFLSSLQEKIDSSLRGGKLSPAYYKARVLLRTGRRPQLNQNDLVLLQQLTQNAVAVTSLKMLNLPITSSFDTAVASLLPTLPTAQHHSAEGDALNGRSTQLHCFSVDPPDLVDQYSPILQFGLEERLLDIMENLLGVPPAFTSVHLRKDVGNGRQVGTRIWHVDTEDQRVVRVLVYLNDVTINDGPFEYIPKKFNARLKPLLERGWRAAGDPILNEEMSTYVPEDDWVQCTGPKGTVVITDNAALFHHGRPHASERIALIYTYTSRHPRYPKIERNPSLDHLLSPRQRSCFFVRTTKRQSA